MSASSISGLLDRRSFLRLGAGALATASAAFELGCSLTTRACKSAPPNPFVAAGKPLLVAVKAKIWVPCCAQGSRPWEGWTR